MKKTSITILAIVFSMAALAMDVPKAVAAAFAKKFPAATNIKWDKENAHEYEASFKMGSKNYSANFNDAGEWLETESSTAFAELPAKVQNAYNSTHNGVAVKAAAKIETAKGEIKYEVEYKSGKKTKEVFYNAEGEVLKN